MASSSPYPPKRLIGPGTRQVPSNVTRISRCFRRVSSDGRIQVVNYQSGVGTGSNIIDTITGGAFGMGIAMRIKEVYSFLAANYFDGDEIILVGFSRGAFTARSVAGMIGKLGLLTRKGIDQFYPIFMDMKRWHYPDQLDQFPDEPFSKKPKGPNAAREYRDKLEQLGLTRVRQNHGKGDLITIKAVACWDTVGSLGIPQFEWLSKAIPAPGSKFWDTSLSDRVEHAFHALALDESRLSFTPAVWERLDNNGCSTDLRQVWFPGTHGNCGGGAADQGIANITLAWMMDQLFSIGIEFDDDTFKGILERSQQLHQSMIPTKVKKTLPFAREPVYSEGKSIRPWGLGAICRDTNFIWRLTGSNTRRPGMCRRDGAGPDGGPPPFLQLTGEKIHSSVRIRLACKGLGPNDKEVWTCPGLYPDWRLRNGTRVSFADFDSVCPKDTTTGTSKASSIRSLSGTTEPYYWVYIGPEEGTPLEQVLAEEVLGPYEQQLLSLTAGEPSVWTVAQEHKHRP